MKAETFAKLANTITLKKNVFITERGKYQISILMARENGDLYFAKWKNDLLVELINLKDIKTKEKKNDGIHCAGI